MSNPQVLEETKPFSEPKSSLINAPIPLDEAFGSYILAEYWHLRSELREHQSSKRKNILFCFTAFGVLSTVSGTGASSLAPHYLVLSLAWISMHAVLCVALLLAAIDSFSIAILCRYIRLHCEFPFFKRAVELSSFDTASERADWAIRMPHGWEIWLFFQRHYRELATVDHANRKGLDAIRNAKAKRDLKSAGFVTLRDRLDRYVYASFFLMLSTVSTAASVFFAYLGVGSDRYESAVKSMCVAWPWLVPSHVPLYILNLNLLGTVLVLSICLMLIQFTRSRWFHCVSEPSQQTIKEISEFMQQ